MLYKPSVSMIPVNVNIPTPAYIWLKGEVERQVVAGMEGTRIINIIKKILYSYMKAGELVGEDTIAKYYKIRHYSNSIRVYNRSDIELYSTSVKMDQIMAYTLEDYYYYLTGYQTIDGASFDISRRVLISLIVTDFYHKGYTVPISTPNNYIIQYRRVI